MDLLQKAIAFYLPQFHPVKENSEWWGKGFTEWTNVAKGKPNFKGHYQPHIPKDLGFYDLRLPSVMVEQINLARKYGVSGFCFYWYWFAGRRILEMPVDQFLCLDSNFPYCLCWANENWTRTWDGQNKRVLLAQAHSAEDDLAFIRTLIPHFNNPRYIRHKNNPVLLIYRTDLFPDMKATALRWRAEVQKAGIPDLHLCAVQYYGIDDPLQWGCDAAVEFPPLNFSGVENKSYSEISTSNPDFTHNLIDYSKVVSQSLSRQIPDYLMYRGVTPSWDNTARRQDNPLIVVNSSPEMFQYWIAELVRINQLSSSPSEFIFINAWNEWAEGCHLEPDLKYGHAFLEATYKGLKGLYPFAGVEKELAEKTCDVHFPSSRMMQASLAMAQENRLLIGELNSTEPLIFRLIKKFVKGRHFKILVAKIYSKIKSVSKENN